LLLPLAVAVYIVLMLCGEAAGAAEPQTLWQRCENGSEAGQCSTVQGIAADSTTGAVYVVAGGDARINEFGPWGEFIKAWGWGVADGANKLETCGPGANPPSSTCRQGIKGLGAGQLGSSASRGIALDAAGDVYIYETMACTSQCGTEANRVQKFTPDGQFILMFGKEVNRTEVEAREAQEAAAEPVTVTEEAENICTAASGDTCGPGTAGSGPGEFGKGPLLQFELEVARTAIAAVPGDKIAVGGQERIQIFSTNGSYEESLALSGKAVLALAVDSAGDIYVASESNRFGIELSEPDVIKLSPTGDQICRAVVQNPRALAVDSQDRLYVAAGTTSGEQITVHRFLPGCAEEAGYEFAVSGLPLSSFSSPAGIATSSACGIEGNLYYANGSGLQVPAKFVRAYFPAPAPALCSPPAVPPTVADQYATTVGTSSADVRARINPHFWPGTTYYVEYGTDDCASAPGACEKKTLFPGAALKGEPGDAALSTAGVLLTGLEPGTTYHYRFVARSDGGGPVHGVGQGEADATFTTYPPAGAAKTDCPNQAFRTGASALLPDCRAYEMVSPVDKEGADIMALKNSTGYPAALDLAAASGDRVTFSASRAFAGAPSAPYASQYVSARNGNGWATEAISPAQEGPAFLEANNLDTHYVGFDEELCNGWLLQPTEPVLAQGAVRGYSNLYRRQGCGPTSFEALTDTVPMFDPAKGQEALLPSAFYPELEGFSAAGGHTIFRARGQLTADAAPCPGGEGGACPRQLYDVYDGAAHLVCVLPSGQPSHEECWAGGNGVLPNGRTNVVRHAISTDGSRVFWGSKFEGSSVFAVGKLYVRIDGSETRTISTAPSRFWTADPDGSRVIYGVYPSSYADEFSKGELFEADLEDGTKTHIADEVAGVLGASEDARRIYFASTEVLTGGERNSQGRAAEAGQPNLYLYEVGGGFTYVATVTFADINSTTAALRPSVFYKTSRVTPDGLHAAFTSLAPLTGADNISSVGGRPVTEVFMYDATTRTLRCASCGPSGARPEGFESRFDTGPDGLWYGGVLPGWPNQIRPSRPLSDDGRRLFFESYEPLLPADTNGRRDVYEWEAGESQAQCREAGAQLFLAREGGCLSLISSGESPADSSFLDAGSSGRDVFFTTASSLLSQDPGLVDVYDAREGGGFAPSPQRPGVCEGEACQGPYSPPQDPTPSSSNFEGPGNVRPAQEAKKQKKKDKKKKHKQRRHKKHKGNKQAQGGSKGQKQHGAGGKKGGHS